MKIGELPLQGNLLLAPMAGITDLPFRNLCRRFGASLAFSEMISADTSLWASRKTQTRLNREGETPPVAVQILGTEPDRLAEAARINVDLGAQIIDINMGCPAKKVCKVAAGSALLRDETRVARILQAVVRAVDVPVTLKIRTGWDPHNRNALNIGRIAEDAGIAMLTIHGRTRACKFTGEAEYETIRQVKQALAIPVVANGDIRDEKKAEQVLKFTGADAIMIGRAAQGRPWIFRHIAHYLDTGEALPPPPPDWIGHLLLEHLDTLYSLYGNRQGVRIARKHIAWYSRDMQGSAEFRRKINEVESTRDQQTLVTDYFIHRGKGEKAA
ncbi:tRNA dihydrouridine synthase DusB [Thiolapillus sp.]